MHLLRKITPLVIILTLFFGVLNVAHAACTPSYSNPGGTGNRITTITVASSGSDITAMLGGGGESAWVDGDTTSNGHGFFSGSTLNGTQWLRFDFGPLGSPIITELTYYQQDSTAQGTWKLQGSNDTSTWTDVGGSFALGGTATETITAPSANTTGYRYYRILGLSGVTSPNPWLYEMEFKLCYTIDDKLLLHYKLDDNAGNTTVVDSAGTSNGTASANTSSLSSTAKLDSGSFSFNVSPGTNVNTNYVWLGSNPNFTLSAWVTLGSHAADNYSIVSSYNGQPGFLSIGVNNGDRATCTAYDTASNPIGATANSFGGLGDGAWHLVTCSLNGTSLTLYVDGVVVGTDSNSLFNSNMHDSNSDPLIIAGDEAGARYLWPGKIDDIRVYTRALSADDVQQLGGLDMDLFSWWKLDDGSGTSAVDSSGNGNTGTLVNSPSWVGGKIGTGALSFVSGNHTYVSSSNFVSGADLSMSFSAWVYPTSYDNSQNSVIEGSNFASGIDVSSSAQFEFTDRVPSTHTYTGATIPLNTWTLLTVVCTADLAGGYANDTVTMYVNGSQVKQDTTSGACANNFTSQAYYVGTLGYSAGNYGWTGYIDDVRLYDKRALSSSDVSAIYALGTLTLPSFFLRARTFSSGGGNPMYPFSTSTSFKLVAASGEAVAGTSSSASFQVQSGFLRNLYRGPAPNYTQIHYHWRNDDGSETTATSKTGGVQDTAVTSISKLSTNRLRIEISNKGGTVLGYSPQQFRLEYGLLSSTCATISSWTDVGAAAGDWDMVDSANLTEGANTTNISPSVGGVSDENHTFISSNAGVKDTSSQVASLSVSSDSFAELEYSIEPMSAATDGGVYCFRVTNAGATTSMAYSKYPQATLSSGGSLTFSIDSSSESFPAVTPGTLSATSSILSVKTTNASGFNISIQRTDTVGTMSLGSTYIPDKTDWFAPGATTTAGNATASTTQPLTLQFRVRQAGTDVPNYASAWWGTDDTTPSALFGGISSTTQTIINRSTAAAATTTAFVMYDLNVPATQKNGTYSGSITYTVTANP